MKYFVVLVLICSLMLTGCTANSIALLDAVITAAEIVIPATTQLSPDDAAAVNQYLNGILPIINELLTVGVNASSLAAAIPALEAVAEPRLSEYASPQVVVLVKAMVNAVDAILKAYATPPKGQIKLNAKDRAKLQSLQSRVSIARGTIPR